MTTIFQKCILVQSLEFWTKIRVFWLCDKCNIILTRVHKEVWRYFPQHLLVQLWLEIGFHKAHIHHCPTAELECLQVCNTAKKEEKKKFNFTFSTTKSNISHYNTVFENHRKSLTQHCERSELRLHFEWTKVY